MVVSELLTSLGVPQNIIYGNQSQTADITLNTFISDMFLIGKCNYL